MKIFRPGGVLQTPPSPSKHRIRRNIREPVADLSIIVTEGEAPDIALDVAQRDQCDLIVIAAARDRDVGTVSPGRTVKHLIRRVPTSVLVVRTRLSGPYRHILGGTDFTDEAVTA